MKRLFALCMLMIWSLGALAGAWSEDSFGNDDALDWVAECSNSRSINLVSATLNSTLNAQYLEAAQGASAIAAAEVVAAGLGNPNANLPGELKAWLAKQPIKELSQLAPLAKKAVQRVQDQKTSELSQLWTENGDGKWAASVNELQVRLGK